MTTAKSAHTHRTTLIYQIKILPITNSDRTSVLFAIDYDLDLVIANHLIIIIIILNYTWQVHERQTARMRTRSEWFLGDGGCGDEDGEHDADTCDCGVGGSAAVAAVTRRNNTKAGSLDHHSSIISADEMDFVSFVPMMMSKRPVTQLFETTSGFGIPESERERNGGGPAVEDVTNLQHLTTNSFGTLSSSPGAYCCVVVDNNNRAAGVVNGGRVSRSRKARSVHGYQQLHKNHLHQRIAEQDEGDEELDKMSLHNGGDRICLIADTHDAPSFHSLVTSSPHQVKKEQNGGGLPRVDGNNNNVRGKDATGNGGETTTKGRTTSLHDCKYDEICVANSSTGSSSLIDNNVDGRKLAVENSHNNQQRHHHGPRHEQRRHGRQRHLNSHLTQSHDDLTAQISRDNRNRRSTRSSASLNRNQKNGNNSNSNDNKLMVLFKILDFIF